MDFRQTIQPNSRSNSHSAPSVNTTQNDSAGTHESYKPASSDHSTGGSWIKILSLAVVVGITVILIMLAIGFRHQKTGEQEAKFVDTSKYQAVFLNNGQVYFGNIQSLTSRYLRMTNVYYLTQGSTDTSSSANNSNYSLVKLGCQQIHDPYDQMLINRDQITFWENLQDSGKVVDSIKKFKAQNPNGPDCSQVSTDTQATNSSNTQGSNTTPTGNSNTNSNSSSSSNK
jgi:hypothetical protein